MLRNICGISLAILALSSSAQASSWDLDAAHSSIGFSIRHAMISQVHGAFTSAKGTLEADEKDPTKSMVDVDIDVASIDTRSDKRDDHLRSGDFFDVKQFPQMHFKSSKIERVGKNFRVHGELSMHGVTKPVTMMVQTAGKAIKDPFGMLRMGFSATTKINRKDFNLNWNKAIEAGGLMVGEEVAIQIDAEFVHQDSVKDNKAAKEAPAGTPKAKE